MSLALKYRVLTVQLYLTLPLRACTCVYVCVCLSVTSALSFATQLGSKNEIKLTVNVLRRKKKEREKITQKVIFLIRTYQKQVFDELAFFKQTDIQILTVIMLMREMIFFFLKFNFSLSCEETALIWRSGDGARCVTIRIVQRNLLHTCRRSLRVQCTL